jgi:hypothetical protein
VSTSSSTYISGRKRFPRPQALLWSDNSGSINNGIYYPLGTENEDFIVLSDHNRKEINVSRQRIETRQRMINATMRSYYIDDKINISLSWENLPSRSYSTISTFDSAGKLITESKTATFTAGQNTVTVNNNVNILVGMNVYGSGIGNNAMVTSILNNVITISSPNTANGTGQTIYFTPFEYTVDGGAGGVQLLDWYETHPGPFWVYLSYDKYNAYKVSGEIVANSFQHLSVYNEIKLMYFASFDYTILKRGIDNFDFWNISLTLEEA